MIRVSFGFKQVAILLIFQWSLHSFIKSLSFKRIRNTWFNIMHLLYWDTFNTLYYCSCSRNFFRIIAFTCNNLNSNINFAKNFITQLTQMAVSHSQKCAANCLNTWVCAADNRCLNNSTNNFLFNGICYVKYENETLTWYQARERCINNGGDLAMFQNDPQNKGYPQLNTSWLNTHTYWVGIRWDDWRWNSPGMFLYYIKYYINLMWIQQQTKCQDRRLSHFGVVQELKASLNYVAAPVLI